MHNQQAQADRNVMNETYKICVLQTVSTFSGHTISSREYPQIREIVSVKAGSNLAMCVCCDHSCQAKMSFVQTIKW